MLNYDDILQKKLSELEAGRRVSRRAPAPSRLLARADLVGVSHHDLDPDTPLADLYPLLRPHAILVVTQGHEGGVAVTLGASGSINCAGNSTCHISCTGSCSLACSTGSTCDLKCTGDSAPKSVAASGSCQ